MAMPYSTFGAAGSFDKMQGQAFMPGKRKRLNGLAIVLNTLLPSTAFAISGWAFAFTMHYEQPMYTWSLLVLFLLISMISFVMGRCNRQAAGQPMWYTFFASTLALASLLGALLGEYLFHYTMEGAFNFQSMSSYPAVNPAKQKGQEIMDAGRVYFSSGTKLDLSKSMSFHNFDEYCVAPIVNTDIELASYDFWAVGINCCNQGRDGLFRCGEYANIHARSGLRYMDQVKQENFFLAVKQAEAAFGIKAQHPLLFTWAQDPLAMINTKVSSAWHFYYVGVATFFFTNLFGVIAALMVFSRLGHL